jgi:Flp pilus assembly protein TadG
LKPQSALGRLGAQSGSQLIEFALVLPILLMIVAGIADFGILLRTNSVTANAAREGARIAVIPGNEENDYALARARVAEALAEGNLTGAAVVTVAQESVTIAPNTLAAGVRVTIDYAHNTLFLPTIVGFINGTFAQTITIQSTAFMRTEIAAVSGT